MAVNESSGWWWFEISGYRWSKRRKTFVISLWARDGVSQPDSGISRKVPKSAKPPSWYPNYNMWLILWPRGCQHHIMSEPCSLHAFFFSWPDIQPIHSYPSWENTPPQCVDFIPNTCWERLKCLPAIPGLSFFFPFLLFKVKPTKPKILWILPNYNLWRRTTAYPSLIKSYAIKILHMSFWREKDVLFCFLLPFSGLTGNLPTL